MDVIIVAVNELRLFVVRDGRRPEGLARPTEADYDDDEGYDEGLRELLIVVDGVAVLDAWGGLGLDPDDLLNPDLPLVPPEDGTPVDRIVQRCGCGIVGCGSLTVTIRRRGGVVEWRDARDGRRRRDIPDFVFDAGRYDEEVRRAHRERPWETRTERIARLVGEALADLEDRRPRSFDWASGSWGDDEVVVCVTDWRPNPRAGQPIGPRTGGWQAVEFDELREPHVGVFPIPAGGDDAAVESILRQVRETDPASWPRPDRFRSC